MPGRQSVEFVEYVDVRPRLLGMVDVLENLDVDTAGIIFGAGHLRNSFPVNLPGATHAFPDGAIEAGEARRS
jgi:hypothetical protein